MLVLKEARDGMVYRSLVQSCMSAQLANEHYHAGIAIITVGCLQYGGGSVSTSLLSTYVHR